MTKETSLAIFGIIAAVSLLAGTFVVIEALPIVFAKESGNTNIKSSKPAIDLISVLKEWTKISRNVVVDWQRISHNFP